MTATLARPVLPGSDAAERLGGVAAKIRWSPGEELPEQPQSSVDCYRDVATDRRAVSSKIREGEVGCIFDEI